MGKGNASDRLNTILSQGSSTKTTEAVSVLDSTKKPITTTSGSVTPTSMGKPSINPDDDPDIMDIGHFVEQKNAADEGGNDFDQFFNKIMGGNGAQSNGDDPIAKTMMDMMNQQEGENDDPFSKAMMNMMSQQEGASNDPTAANQDVAYQKQLLAHNIYQQRLWKYRFLVVRILAVLINFFYHYLTLDGHSFRSSPHFYIRGFIPQNSMTSFITWFLTCEVAILASFYFVTSTTKAFANANDNSIILKGISMGSMVLPQLRAYQPMAIRIANYWELFGMFLVDISLVVILFGFFSLYK